MSFGITIIINEDGTIEIRNNKSIHRAKGKNLIELPCDYTVIDVETTGLDPSYDEIIEIGAIKVRNNEINSQFSSLVKPSRPIDEFIENLTGITNEMLKNAPSIKEVLPQFIDFINDDILLGHNIHFDINFLYYNLDFYLDYKLSNNFIDLMRLTRKVYPNLENHKLVTIAEFLNINIENHHRSLADCLTTHKCYQVLARQFNYDSKLLKSLWRTHISKSLDLRNITAETNNFNTDHPLYNKYCVFTGKLEKLTRKEAAQLVVNLGGKCQNNITKQTNFLIVGNFDYCSNIKGGKSSKLKKAEKLILQGQDLQILSENTFYDLVLNNE